MLSFECIKNEKSVYFLLTSAFLGCIIYFLMYWTTQLLCLRSYCSINCKRIISHLYLLILFPYSRIALERIFFKIYVNLFANIAYQISNKRKNNEPYGLTQFSDFSNRNTAPESTKRLIQIVNSCNQSERRNVANSFCAKRNCMKRNG